VTFLDTNVLEKGVTNMPMIQTFARPENRRVSVSIPQGYEGYSFEVILVPVEEPTQKRYDFSAFAGKVKYPEDGVSYQRRVRDEW